MLQKVERFAACIDARHIFTVLLVALAITLLMFEPAFAKDLLAAGDANVQGTVGKDSSVLKWLMIIEVLAAIFAFIVTRNIKMFGGIVVIAIFIDLCYIVIAGVGSGD